MHAVRQDQELQAVVLRPGSSDTRSVDRGAAPRAALTRSSSPSRAWPGRLLRAMVITGLLAPPAFTSATGIEGEPPKPPGDRTERPDSSGAGKKERDAPEQNGRRGARDGEERRDDPEAKPEDGTGESGKKPGKKNAEGTGKKAARENGKKNGKKTASGRSPKQPKAKPAKAALPVQGVYKASKLVRLAGDILDCPVRIADTGVETRKIEVVPLLAGQLVTLDELRLLLAFYRVYLFDSEDPEEGRVLVATTDPRWTPRQARYSHVLEVSSLAFKRVWARLKAAIETHNASLALNEAAVVAVPVESVGKIFLRAPNKKTLERMIELVRSEDESDPPADRTRLFAYIGRFRHVRSLQNEVLEELTKSERARTRFVVMRTGNRLLFSAPGRLGERITEMLEKADRRRK